MAITPLISLRHYAITPLISLRHYYFIHLHYYAIIIATCYDAITLRHAILCRHATCLRHCYATCIITLCYYYYLEPLLLHIYAITLRRRFYCHAITIFINNNNNTNITYFIPLRYATDIIIVDYHYYHYAILV